MQCLHPSLFVAGIWLLSWGIASAQAPTNDAASTGQGRDAVARECHAVLEPRVSDEVSVSSGPVVQRLRTLGDVLAAIVTQAIDRSTTSDSWSRRSVKPMESCMWSTADAGTAFVPACLR